MKRRALDVISEFKVVLCAGPGGVGKTTTSATLALSAAVSGKKVCVLTIDPARRLADALGIRLDNEPHQVDCQPLLSEGLQVRGELWAMMLDPAKTFDGLINRIAPTQKIADSVLNNLIYRQMSRGLAGTIEYTAVEKLYSLYTSSDFDLVIVDTPPSKNVLDFLEAPEWISRFMDEKVFKWFSLLDPKEPATGLKENLVKKTGRVVWEVLDRTLGRELATHFTDFIHSIRSMAGEFRERGDCVAQMLRSEDCSFLIVTAPNEIVLRDARFLCKEIRDRGIQFSGFVVNRASPGAELEALGEAFDSLKKQAGDDPAAAEFFEQLTRLAELKAAQGAEDWRLIRQLRQDTAWDGFLGVLPKQTQEITDLNSLHGLALQF